MILSKTFVPIKEIKIELFLFTLLVFLFAVRTINPILKYPFILLYSFYIIYLIIYFRNNLFSILKETFSYLAIFYLLFFYLLFSIFLSEKIYLNNVKDVVSIILLFTLMFGFKTILQDKQEFKLFYKLFLFFTILFALIISVTQINDYINKPAIEYIIDYNFALLPIVFGMVAVLFILSTKEISKLEKIYYDILLFMFSICFLISGSKRGIFVFLLLYLSILGIQFFIFFRKLRNSLIRKNTIRYFLTFTLSIVLICLISSTTSIYTRNNLLRKVGFKNVYIAKMQITQSLYRYAHIFDKSINDRTLYNKIWKPVFDPKDPDAGWGGGNYKIVENLSGDNVEIVPSGTKGCLIDSTYSSINGGSHAYYYQIIKKDIVKEGDSVDISIFCYASNNFDGNAEFIAFGSLNENIGRCDFYRMGKWHKLSLHIGHYKGNISVCIYIAKTNVVDFSTMKGYIIFAYPDYKIVSKENLKEENSISESILNQDYNKNTSYLIDKSISNNIYNSSILSFALNSFVNEIQIIKDKDPIRSYIAKFISEDTTYHPYKSKLVDSYPQDKFGEDRTSRWRFALEIYIKEYNWKQKLFGGGFNFLNWYGSVFLKDKTKSDYPHNPFLHILLYSGILGVILYIILLYKVLFYYWSYKKEYPLFLIFFLITYYFTFFSGGNPFDPPTMGFLIMLPFFIHFAQKN